MVNNYLLPMLTWAELPIQYTTFKSLGLVHIPYSKMIWNSSWWYQQVERSQHSSPEQPVSRFVQLYL